MVERKTWELLKHLEEGGTIESDGVIIDSTNLPFHLCKVNEQPSRWTMIKKPKTAICYEVNGKLFWTDSEVVEYQGKTPPRARPEFDIEGK